MTEGVCVECSPKADLDYFAQVDMKSVSAEFGACVCLGVCVCACACMCECECVYVFVCNLAVK